MYSSDRMKTLIRIVNDYDKNIVFRDYQCIIVYLNLIRIVNDYDKNIVFRDYQCIIVYLNLR